VSNRERRESQTAECSHRKSQIAIEYSYRTRDQSPTKWVFWVHAGNQARFEAGYRRIAGATKMDGWNDPKVNILRLVHNWLCDDSNGQWTMIVDNADDATVFYPNVSQIHAVRSSEHPLEPLSDYIPHSPNGSILITSRNHSLAERLTGNYSGVIQVMPMSKNDALVLLEKKLGFAAIEDKASDLVDILEAMPLAITQAAAFIRKQGPRMSVSKYVDAVRSSDKDQARLLGKDLGDSRRDSQATNSIIATWQISFEHIRNSLPTAANLLSLMSLFDRQGIPERLVQDRYSNDQEEADFDDDIQTLSSFSLIRISADGSEFEMHRLVQLATKKWLELHNKLEKWKGTLAMVMKDNYPYGEYENWPTCQPLFPHVQAMSSNKPKETEALKAWASVCHNAAWYLFRTGQQSKALEFNSAVLQVRESILEPEHFDLLCTLNDMGVILARQGKYRESETAHRKALDARVRVLGEHNPKTLESMSNLALTYVEQGRYKDAEKLEFAALQKRTESFGEDHPDTLSSMHSLAVTYFLQGRRKEAEELGIKVVQKRTKSLGEDHPDTLLSMNDFALIYGYQGRLKEAEELVVKVLQKRTKILGEEHPDTHSSMNNLASVYHEQNRYKEAEALGIKVVQKCTKSLGEDHPDTLISKYNLALIYTKQKRYKEAEELGIKVLQKRIKNLGEEHPDTLTSMSFLAYTYKEQERFKEAEELNIKVFQASRKTLGEEHPDTLKYKHNLAFACKDLGRHTEAVDMMRTCVEQRRRILGPEHPKTLLSSRELAAWEAEQTRGADSEEASGIDTEETSDGDWESISE
jgi:tetratricopeptide (TPR) repeat protein